MTERYDTNDPERATQAEIREQAAHEGDDPQTSREELELDLQEGDASEAGQAIGDEQG